MKAIIQKVTRSSVLVDGQIVGSIGKGYNVLLGIGSEDTIADADWIVKKLLNIRLWSTADAGTTLVDTPISQRWNNNIVQCQGSILLISQFTLYGQLKGNKVDFHHAMKGDAAKTLYEKIILALRAVMTEEKVQTGIFGAMMEVTIVNDGPVTIELDSKARSA